MNVSTNRMLISIVCCILIILCSVPAIATPPEVSIDYPPDYYSSAEGDYINFQASGTDPDEGTLITFEWTSTKDGILKDENDLDLQRGSINTLSRGTHIITLVATTNRVSNDESTTVFITLFVREEPSASILNPANNSELRKGIPVTFEGVGTDDLTADDDDLTSPAKPLEYTWESITVDGGEGDGVLSKSPSFTALGPDSSIDLSYGEHEIRFTVEDRDGDSAYSEVTIEVLNTNPTAVINSPLSETTHNYEEVIIFDGSGSYDGLMDVVDEDDNELLSSNFDWTSSIDDLSDNNEGEQIVIDDLTIGTHLITLTVMDNQGGIGTDTITLTIQNPPTATINRPTNLAVFEDDAEIEFKGDATDEEDPDDALTLEWKSNLDGILSTSRSFTTTNLSDGEHTIILTVTDTNGASTEATITISTSNNLPTATISAPSAQNKFAYGESITFTGNGKDYLNADLTGSSLVWTTDTSTTPMGTGNSTSVDNLISGKHIITLTVTDSFGKISTDAINITVGLHVSNNEGNDINNLQIQGENEIITVSDGVQPYRIFYKYPISAFILGSEITVTGEKQGTGTLTITDAEGTNAEIMVSIIEVVTIGEPPVAYAGNDQIATEGSTVTLDALQSFDADDDIVSFRWQDNLVTLSDDTAAQPTFVTPPVDENGMPVTIQLTVEDESDNQDTDEVLITIVDNGITRYPSNVTSFFSATDKEMGILAESGGNLTSLTPINPSTMTNTKGMPANMIYGLIDFDVKLINQVETVWITVYLPEPAPPGYRWYKYTQTNGWIDFSRDVISGGSGDGAVFSDDRTKVYLYITDNGAYDNDNTTLMINDPSGLGTSQTADKESDSGFGCFIAGAGDRPL